MDFNYHSIGLDNNYVRIWGMFANNLYAQLHMYIIIMCITAQYASSNLSLKVFPLINCLTATLENMDTTSS